MSLSLLVLGGCSSPEARRARHMSRGQEYLRDGNLEKAQVEFQNVLQIAPGDITARVLLGQVAERKGSIREAFGDYRAAVDMDPQNPVARSSLGRIYVFANEPITALELVEPALMRYPNDPDLLTVRGSARQELRDTDAAFSDARRAVQVAPQNENAIALLASLYVTSRDGARAVTLLQGSLKHMPGSIPLRQILASVYQSLDEPQLVESQYLEIVKLAPKEFRYRLQLAQFYQRGHRPGDAEEVLKKAVAAMPRENDAKLAYVEFVSSARSVQDGRRLLNEFISRDPQNYDLQLGLGEMQLKSADLKGALDTYRRIVANGEDHPQTLIARNRIATILVTQGQTAQALALVSEVLQRSPRDSDALIMRGNIELQRGDSAAAIADLRAVLRDQPEDVPILRTLARAHLANGEPELAEGSLRDAMKAAPRSVGVRLDLAQLLMESNRYASALAILEETVLEAPTSLEARVALARGLLAARQYPMAGRAAEDLRQVAPQSAIGWYLGGLAAVAQSRPDDARTQFERGLELEPHSIDLITSLVKLEVSTDHLPQAFARAEAAVAAQPHDALPHNVLGELYLASNNYPKAADEFAAAIQLDGQLWLAYRNLALTQISSRDLNAATRTYENALGRIGLNPDLVVDLAALYERQGRSEDAIKLYQTLHDRRPHLTVIANNLAMLLVTYRKDPISLNEAQELTASFDRSDSPSLLDTEGWVHLKSGNVVGALPLLTAASAYMPKSRIIRYHLGMAEVAAKQLTKARTDLQAALQGTPDFVGAEEARSALAKLRM